MLVTALLQPRLHRIPKTYVCFVGAYARGQLGMVPDFRFDGMNELLSDGAQVAGTQTLGELSG
jgi:hypothetical protein